MVSQKKVVIMAGIGRKTSKLSSNIGDLSILMELTKMLDTYDVNEKKLIYKYFLKW